VLHLDVGRAHRAHVYAVQQQCAIAIGNSAANSRKASETFASDTDILQGFSNLLQKQETREELELNVQRVRETSVLALKNMAATSQDAAHRIASVPEVLLSIKRIASEESGQVQNMAIGAINSFSRSPACVPLLIDMGIVADVLIPTLFEEVPVGEGGRHDDLRILTVTSALANTTVNTPAGNMLQRVMQDWLSKEQGKTAVANLVKCLALSLQDSRWEQVSFSPSSVLTPLYNILRSCPLSSCSILVESDIVRHLCDSLDMLVAQVPRDKHALEPLVMCVRMLILLAAHVGEGCRRAMRILGITSQVQRIRLDLNARSHAWTPLQRKQADVERLDELSELASALGDLDHLVEILTLAPLALCMGMHQRIGKNSALYMLDRDVLGQIGMWAFVSE